MQGYICFIPYYPKIMWFWRAVEKISSENICFIANFKNYSSCAWQYHANMFYLTIFGIFFFPEDLLSFPSFSNSFVPLITLLYCSIGSVCIAFVLQMVGQKYSPPNEAAIVMSTEAIFAAFFGWIILAEFFNSRICVWRGVMAAWTYHSRGTDRGWLYGCTHWTWVGDRAQCRGDGSTSCDVS